MIGCVSKALFSKQDDHMIYSRTYLEILLWDIRMPKDPIRELLINDYLDKKLVEVYDNDAIFDKFDMAQSPNSDFLLTGTYDSQAHIIDITKEEKVNTGIDVDFKEKRGTPVGLKQIYKG
jgi:serine/threonine-protein phosphatase 2A regulatory subunit B